MTVEAEGAVSLVFFGDVSAVDTLQYFLVNLGVAFTAGCCSYRIDVVFR